MARVSGTGSFGNGPSIYDHQQTTFDQDARRTLNGEATFDDASPFFEEWSAEKQRQAFEGLRRSDVNLAALRENSEVFIANNPIYLDTPENGAALNRCLKALFGDCVHTTAQFQKAFEVCCANNNLQLNQAEIEKQQKAAAKQRTQAERSRIVNLTEEELEALPLEEIRRRAIVEHQRQMQEAGERGGNGF